ncbi:fungal zn(2)-Cys(6) binuclear cluster domain-containing protein [Rhizoctonia solani AG-1 IA]|uniref:Fungal zn(2)-Cys(6) binuclear cluster domain-containing protein n=1 Tax=Thanatephorus cucumeris (strain AG1-IA) TaxID=983506 RepID=L8WY03_THACA|nr:fungal zn(2)-Cys(6) binuclear cluster domain-containing protein [Rhizoctonia solani AG-1 IA]
MPSKPKSGPGPRPESCLTCRQRKKKCDKTRPFCLRCLNSKGAFPCLGYGDETYEPPTDKPSLEERVVNTSGANLRPLVFGVEFGDPESSAKVVYYGTRVSASDINDYLTPAVISLTDRSSPESSLMSIASSMHHPVQDADWEPGVRSHGSDNAIRLSLPSMIPRGVNANRWMRESYLTFILGEFQFPDYRHRILKFFRPPTKEGPGHLIANLSRPRRLGYMYLGAKIFETFVGKPEEMAIQSSSQWVTRYANHVTSSEELQNPFPSVKEVEDRLSGLLHVRQVNLQRLDHWAKEERNGLLCISLPSVLTSFQADLQRFVYQDIVYSLILGVPTQAEYDSTELPTAPGTNISADWFHDVQGAPAEMVIIISEVHNWRAQVKSADWRELEMRAWAWNRADTRYEESNQLIYRTAIQEAWRHEFVLMMVLKGMCGVTSHDARVQASVYQIVKLMEVVGDTTMDVHFSITSLAGISARYETQRALIFRKLRSFSGIRLWAIQGRDFARVLDSLWHSAAIYGGAVVWDDYVQMRCEVLPIL